MLPKSREESLSSVPVASPFWHTQSLGQVGRIRGNAATSPFLPSLEPTASVYHQRGLSEAWTFGSDPIRVFNLSPSTPNGGDPLQQVNLLSRAFRDFVRGQVSASA